MCVANELPGSLFAVGRKSDRRLALANDQPRGLVEVDRIAIGGEPVRRHLYHRLGHVPDVGQGVAHLLLEIATGLDGGPAGCEGGAAACGVSALGNRVGVGNPRMHPIHADPQGFGQLHGDGCPSAANVRRRLQHGDGTVPVEARRGR